MIFMFGMSLFVGLGKAYSVPYKAGSGRKGEDVRPCPLQAPQAHETFRKKSKSQKLFGFSTFRLFEFLGTFRLFECFLRLFDFSLFDFSNQKHTVFILCP